MQVHPPGAFVKWVRPDRKVPAQSERLFPAPPGPRVTRAVSHPGRGMLIGGPSRPARRRSLRRAARLCGLLGDCTSDPPTGRCALDPDAIWPLKVRVRERLFEQGGAVYLIQAVRRPCACRAGACLRVWRRKRRPKPRDLFRVPGLAVIIGLLYRGPANPSSRSSVLCGWSPLVSQWGRAGLLAQHCRA